jgi:hypothetical protein
VGTSKGYGGSGGDWNEVSEELADWLDSLPSAPITETSQTDGDPHGPTDNDTEPIVSLLRPFARILNSGGAGTADGPSGGGGVSSGAVLPGGRSPSRTGRSRRRVGRVGGRLASGVLALRAGDQPVLSTLGLSLTELAALDPYRQAQLLVEAATGAERPTTLEEEELHTAAYRVAVWSLTSDEAVPAEDVIRRFVAEYVYEVFLTENGSSLRSADHDGASMVAAEQLVKSTIEALSKQISLDGELASGELEQVVESVYQQALHIFSEPN